MTRRWGDRIGREGERGGDKLIVTCPDGFRRSEEAERRLIDRAHLKITVRARWRGGSRLAIRCSSRFMSSSKRVDLPVLNRPAMQRRKTDAYQKEDADNDALDLHDV